MPGSMLTSHEWSVQFGAQVIESYWTVNRVLEITGNVPRPQLLGIRHEILPRMKRMAQVVTGSDTFARWVKVTSEMQQQIELVRDTSCLDSIARCVIGMQRELHQLVLDQYRKRCTTTDIQVSNAVNWCRELMTFKTGERRHLHTIGARIIGYYLIRAESLIDVVEEGASGASGETYKSDMRELRRMHATLAFDLWWQHKFTTAVLYSRLSGPEVSLAELRATLGKAFPTVLLDIIWYYYGPIVSVEQRLDRLYRLPVPTLR